VINSGYTGTVRYMAPEVLMQDKGHYTEKVDIFSAGKVMWFMATGDESHPEVWPGAAHDMFSSRTWCFWWLMTCWLGALSALGVCHTSP